MAYAQQQVPSGSRANRDGHCRIVVVRGERVTSMRIRPWLVGSLLGGALLLGAGYIGSAAYLILHDDSVAASIERQASIRSAYEDRLSELRVEIDRLYSRALVQKSDFESELTRLAERQARLDARQDVIAGISQAARRAGIVIPRLRPAPASGVEDDTPQTEASVTVESLDRAADRLAARQETFMTEVAAALDRRRRTLHDALARIDLEPDDTADEADATSIGGPFVPLRTDPATNDFRAAAAALVDDIEVYRRMAEIAAATPLARPLESAKMSSRFGRRVDPFLRRPALHSGLDFRAPSGTEVHATAPGKVVSAGRNGGYGRMVVIDHGNGMTTRYAHLSRISVKKGQAVAAGEIVGKVGTTGRSTGPHLHYEIRRDGKAVDPAPFLDVGAEIKELIVR